MIGAFKCRARVAAAAIAVVAASLQVRAGAKAAAFARHHKAARAIGGVFHLVHGFHQPTEHFHRHGVHHLRVIERQRSDMPVNAELCAFKFHLSSPVLMWLVFM